MFELFNSINDEPFVANVSFQLIFNSNNEYVRRCEELQRLLLFITFGSKKNTNRETRRKLHEHRPSRSPHSLECQVDHDSSGSQSLDEQPYLHDLDRIFIFLLVLQWINVQDEKICPILVINEFVASKTFGE